MARSKVSRSGFDAISEAVVVLSVVVFFAVALAIGFGGNALTGLRDRLGVRPPAVAGATIVPTTTVSPTPTSVETTPLPVTAFQVATPVVASPVSVIATVDAIMTAHAELPLGSEPPLTTPTASLESTTIPTEIQPTPTEIQPGPTETQPSLTETQPASTVIITPTMTTTLPSQTPTGLATNTPTNFPATSTSTAMTTPTPNVSTPTITSTHNPPKVVSTPKGPATATPLPPLPAAPTSVATSAATSTSSYAPPVLIGSSPGAGAIVLSWSEATPLGPNDFFDVRVWPDGQPAYGIANVQQPSFVIGGNFPAGTYNWTIAIIRKQGGQIVTLAHAPTTLRFSWVPAGSGSSGGGPPQR